MKKIVIMFLLVIPSIVNAQFSNDGQVYGFKHYKTVTDGVPEKVANGNYMFVYFYDYDKVEMECDGLSEYKRNKYQDAQYPLSEIKKKIREREKMINKDPDGFLRVVSMHKYDSQYSNTNRYTYRVFESSSKFIGSRYGVFVYKWQPFSYGNYCYSFSTDLSEMISWNLDNPNGYRQYYKRIDIDSLGEDDLDFLLE